MALMCGKALKAVQTSIESLNENQIEQAEEVVAADVEIDQLEVDIDHEAIRYLSLRSPVAVDLRFVTVAIKASHDLERVGDEAKNIAKRGSRILRRRGVIHELFSIPEMAQQSFQMMQLAVDCFIEEDAERAKSILRMDESVDALNKTNLRVIVDAAKQNPDEMDSYIDLIFISKSLERIADHATNLAEEIIFMKTAEETRHHRM